MSNLFRCQDDVVLVDNGKKLFEVSFALDDVLKVAFDLSVCPLLAKQTAINYFDHFRFGKEAF